MAAGFYKKDGLMPTTFKVAITFFETFAILCTQAITICTIFAFDFLADFVASSNVIFYIIGYLLHPNPGGVSVS